MAEDGLACVYGEPPPELVLAPQDALQVSPMSPGAGALEEIEPASLSSMVVAAPPGTLERRYVLALALRALRPGASLIALAPKDKGGARLGAELRGFGCTVEEAGRRHHRICTTSAPIDARDLDTAITAGNLQEVEGVGWTQPGVFSWDRPDPGSERLAAALPALYGHGADLGCGTGLLARAVLTQAAVTRLDLIELDRRALDAARRNVVDARAVFHWADVRGPLDLANLDFVVVNPPFHDAGVEDKPLGQAFIRAAHGRLRPGGALWLVANRHLPYEGVLTPLFTAVTLKAQDGGFKIYEARK